MDSVTVAILICLQGGCCVCVHLLLGLVAGAYGSIYQVCNLSFSAARQHSQDFRWSSIAEIILSAFSVTSCEEAFSFLLSTQSRGFLRDFKTLYIEPVLSFVLVDSQSLDPKLFVNKTKPFIC